ncbi:phage portal protein [Candidatus Pacearchaeota archaeon]|nr:phage portal protein [Candidatus Pacearchaeota archaeon]
MSIIDWAKKLNYNFRLGKSGAAFNTMELPPALNYEQYLRIYGQVGWLFGAVSIIANSVADVSWHLKTGKKGDQEEIFEHPMLDMWQYVNPFQTKYQFIELIQMYLGLVGEAFIVLNFNRLGVPAEMWIAPPQFMTIIPDPKIYISHYEYKRGGSILRLEVPEVIHIFSPNPNNPYRGIGPSQSIAVDLDSERYASRYQQRLFYNDATPGLLIEYPEVPEKSERDKIRKEWDEIHRGWRNARKTGFLWGGAKANTVALTNKDMDFMNLRKINRETILGAFHVPTSLMGLSEVGSRARAEADEYIFAKYTIRPALTRIQEALNEQLVPLFDESLRFEYDDPVPTDRTTIVEEVSKLVPYGIITREEGRRKLGYNPEPAKGETFLSPMNLLPSTVKMLEKHKSFNEEQKEARWRVYASKSEREEVQFKRQFKKLWDVQAREVAEAWEISQSLDQSFDDYAAVKEWTEKFEPLITQVFTDAFELATSGAELMPTQSGRPAFQRSKSEGITKVLNPLALAWIANRSLTLAQEVNGTTKKELRKELAAGFASGESTDKIARRIRSYYRNDYKRRADVVARTEVIAANNEGALEGYENEGITQSEFYAALDERTCEDCMGYHAQVYPIMESHGIIPIHPNCRCTWVPIVD